MTVLTFNIRNGLAEDGINSWENRRTLTAQTIRDANADIIGLQEVYDFQLNYLVDQLPEYSSYSVGREDGIDKGEHCPILWRRNRFRKTAAETFWLSDTITVPNSMTWGNSITRICSWVEFEDGFRFYNTHWDHESQWARAKSAELIVDILPITPWILVGDFNAEPASDELQVLAQAPDIVFISKDNLVGTFHNFQGCLDGERIDHLFTSAKLSANLTRVIMSHQGDLYPSDHYPVLFEVSL